MFVSLEMFDVKGGIVVFYFQVVYFYVKVVEIEM